MFRATGVKGTQVMFLMTDAQVIDERFLVYINAILSSGWISGLFPKDEIDGMLKALHTENLIEVSTGRFSSIQIR